VASETRGTKNNPCYFLVSVSTRENLDLCIKHALAGFPSSESGAWTFCEIREGDFVSFLYGARAHNLYEVGKREAIIGAEHFPPWKPLVFEDSGKTHSFPFRLWLRPIRTFVESIARHEFFYVAENLLMRGGYRKTHFQADQTTLQRVSEMGTRSDGSVVALPLPEYATFALRFTRSKELIKKPETFRFQETILQSALRRHLMSDDNLQTLLSRLSFTERHASDLEVLGEKALMQGHIDLLLKQRVPIGSALEVPIEVKTKKAHPDDVSQLRGYMNELLGECPVGLLIAADFNKHVVAKAMDNGIRLVRYTINTDIEKTPTFEEIYQSLTLEPLEK
jgi:hypothetical protein